MFDSTDFLDLRNPQNVLFRAVYAEKKILRQQLRSICIASIIAKLQAGNVPIRTGGFAILGLAKILTRKLRYLLDDCNEIVYLVCRKGDKDKGLKALPARGITLNLDLDSMYIDDDMVNPEDFVVLPEIEDIQDVVSTDVPEFGEFNDMSYVEQARASSADITRLSAATDMTQIQVEKREKRRRIVVDLEAELDPQKFRENLRNTRDIISKENVDIGDELVSKLVIAPEILSGIKSMTSHPRGSVEGVRNGTMTESYMDLDLQNDVLEDRVSEDMLFEHCLDLKDLPSEFIFNDAVRGLSRAERSKCFSSLLNLLCKGEMTAKQAAPYSPIECKAA